MNKKLLKLADFIEQNPDLYQQGGLFTCIIGLGNRYDLKHKVLRSVKWYDKNYTSQEGFIKKFDVTSEATRYLFGGLFNYISRNFENWSNDFDPDAKYAANVIRYVAGAKRFQKTC